MAASAWQLSSVEGATQPEVTAQALAEVLDPQLVARLAAQARAQGVSLLGREGLLQQLTKRFLEAALEAEMDEHLGYGKHEPVGRNRGNSRNGKRCKTLLTEVGAGAAAVIEWLLVDCAAGRCRVEGCGRFTASFHRLLWPKGRKARSH